MVISAELEHILSEVRQLEIAKDYWKDKYMALYQLYQRNQKLLMEYEGKNAQDK